MKVLETEDPCLFYIQFDSKKEEKYYKDKIREWSGKKRISAKQVNEWAIYVIKEFIKNQEDSKI